MDNQGNLEVDDLVAKTKRSDLKTSKEAIKSILYVLFIFGLVIAYDKLIRDSLESWLMATLRN